MLRVRSILNWLRGYLEVTQPEADSGRAVEKIDEALHDLGELEQWADQRERAKLAMEDATAPPPRVSAWHRAQARTGPLAA
jgi:hypothetical protein